MKRIAIALGLSAIALALALPSSASPPQTQQLVCEPLFDPGKAVWLTEYSPDYVVPANRWFVLSGATARMPWKAGTGSACDATGGTSISVSEDPAVWFMRPGVPCWENVLYVPIAQLGVRSVGPGIVADEGTIIRVRPRGTAGPDEHGSPVGRDKVAAWGYLVKK